MCLGIPGKVLEIEMDALGLSRGRVAFGNISRDVNFCYTPGVQVGDYVLVHIGYAINRLDQQEAAEIFSLLERLSDA